MPIATIATTTAELFWSITDKKRAGTGPAALRDALLVQTHRHTGTVLDRLIDHALVYVSLAGNRLY